MAAGRRLWAVAFSIPNSILAALRYPFFLNVSA
jgi:hypothetical protein